MSTDLAINLLAALIAFCTGFAVRALVHHFRSRRPAGRVWRNPRRASFSVVVADGPIDRYGNTSVHPAEFAAATEICSFLARAFRVPAPKVSVSNDFPIGPALEEDLIVIGGPIHNAIHRAVVEKTPIPYEFQGRRLVRDDGRVFEPVNAENGLPTIDYGLIVVTPNPFNENKRVVLLAGCRTFGCLGAARAMTDPFVTGLAPLLDRGRTCCVVVKMDVLASWVGRIEVVDHAVC